MEFKVWDYGLILGMENIVMINNTFNNKVQRSSIRKYSPETVSGNGCLLVLLSHGDLSWRKKRELLLI